MKFLISITAAAGAVSAGTVSMVVSRHTDEAAGPDVQTRHPRDLQIRGTPFQAILSPLLTRYMVDVEVGTPPQRISTVLDTGSNDLWFHASNSQSCGPRLQCGALYNIQASKTAQAVHSEELQGSTEFRLRYNVGDIGVNGTYVKDTVTIAGATIREQIVGAATQGNIQLPILGLGPQAPPSTLDRRLGATYNGVVDTMVLQGVISRRAFSIFLNQMSTKSGNLLLGGIDTEKYYDSLVRLPMVPTERGTHAIVRYGINLKQMSANGIEGIPTLASPIPAVLDTGSPVLLLPAEIVGPILKHANAIVTQTGDAMVDCGLAKSEKTVFEFIFEGKTIFVPFRDAVLDVFSNSEMSGLRQLLGAPAKNWQRVCFFGFKQGAPGSFAILGDPFLRNIYSVFDNDDHTISLAQARFDSKKSNVIEIPANGQYLQIQGLATPKTFDLDVPSDSKDDKNSSAQSLRTSAAVRAVSIVGALMICL